MANARAIRAGQTKFKARKRAKMSPPPPGEQADATTGASGFLALTEAPFVQQQRPLRPPGTPCFPGGFTGHPGDAFTVEEAAAAAAKASAKGQAAVSAAQAQQQGNVPTGAAGEQDAEVCQGKKMKKKKKKREGEADASKPLAGKKKQEDGVSKKKVKKKKAAPKML